MAVRLPEDFVDFMESGVSVLVASRDEDLRPECMRAVGVSVAADRQSMTLFLSEVMAGRTLENLRDNGEIAVSFSRPIDHRSLQVKGRVTALRPAMEEDRSLQDRYLIAYVEQLYLVGLPRSLARRVRSWPSVAVSLQIADVFVQTPGPGAGRRVDQSGRVA
ncbi:MAG TPA: pyridoxamine 5'-phosphate oxidase family protein [Polyangiaceae bacterium]